MNFSGLGFPFGFDPYGPTQRDPQVFTMICETGFQNERVNLMAGVHSLSLAPYWDDQWQSRNTWGLETSGLNMVKQHTTYSKRYLLAKYVSANLLQLSGR